jgi:hypothetical protein
MKDLHWTTWLLWIWIAIGWVGAGYIVWRFWP